MASTARRRRIGGFTPRDERGAILVTAAILMVALATFAGLALAGGAVYGAAQEGRKAADFAALAGAANLPTLNFGTTPNPLGLPPATQQDTPLGTLDTSSELLTLGQDFSQGVCDVAARQFGGGRAVITDKWGPNGTTCQVQYGFANQWLQYLADCMAGATQAADCASRLESGVSSLLPAPDQTAPAVAALQDATKQAGATGQVVTSQLLAQIQALNTTLGGQLTPLLSLLNSEGGVSVNMTRLAPALLTPDVTVTIKQEVDVPGAALVGGKTVELHTGATARRAIKNAVILPTVALPQAGGPVAFDPNGLLLTARDAALGALDQVGSLVTPAADQAMHDIVCPGMPSPCPVVSDSFTDAEADVRDAVDPPNGQAPDAVTLVNEAVAQGDPIMVAITSYAVDPSQVLGSTIYNLPGVKQLLPSLLFIPAFEMVPAVLSAGPLGQVFVTPVETAVDAGKTKGLYRARLVD